MPGAMRRIDSSLIDRLRDQPYRFEFFQAVRVLLGHYREQGQTRQDRDILGQVIRFRNSVSLSFPPSEIEALVFEQGDGDDIAEGRLPAVTLTPSFIGLTGPMGVMPRHYTHYVAEREIYHRDMATRAFLDIFSGRAVALFYQTWLKYRLHLQYESDRKNRFLPLVLSLGGLGFAGTRQRLEGADEESGKDGIADESLAYYVGALRERPQSAQWFARIVADYFSVKCKVEQFTGMWFQLPAHELTRLGGTNCELGNSALCGDRVWDRSSKVSLTIGPLRKQQFEDFLPGKKAAQNLQRLFGIMVGATFDCEVRLVLDKRDLQPAVLGNDPSGSRLGWSGWLSSGQAGADSRDVAYLIGANTGMPS